MTRKRYASTALIALFIGQIVFVAISLTPYFNSTTTDTIGSDGNTLIDTPTALPSASDTADTWWNESYTHRLLIAIQEPNIYQRDYEPVEVYIEFEYGTHLIDSTRLVKFATSTWTPQSFQLSNVTDDGTYVQSFTMTFQVNINLNETLEYYVYYSDDPGITAYSPVSSLTTNFDGTTAYIDNGHYEIEFAEGAAMYYFEYQGSNYHTENSFGPLSKVLQPGETTYSTDTRGFITDWLLVGPFEEPTTWSSFASVSGLAHLDVTENYVAGDNATGGDALVGINESMQWVEYHDADYRINLGAIYGGDDDYVTSYAMTYVYADSDLENIYLKVAADDGIGVIMDNQLPRLLYDHTRTALGSSDRYVSAAFNMSKGWHSFLVFSEEAGGNWEFTMRFSTDATLRSLTDGTNAITNLRISQIPQTEISLIEELVSGPVYSQYTLNWTDSQDMSVYDTLTFYDNLNMWKCERTFHWDEYHVSPDNSSFSALNTYYDASDFDEFLYDNQRTFGLTNEISAQDYTMVRDFEGGNSLTTLGIFLEGIENGSQNISLDEINWTTIYETGTPNTINIVPGNETNLDNSMNGSPESYTITMTFWEFIDDSIGIVNDYSAALSHINGIYNGLMNPVEVTFGTTEDLFFTLDISCLDHDNSYAAGINITLINATDPGVWDNPVPNSAITDENGEVHFERLKESDYTVNVTYEDFGKILYLETVSIGTLDSSQSIEIDELSLTRLDLSLQSTGIVPEPIIGANVTFYSNISGSSELIGDVFSDIFGVASLYWSNLSASDNYTFGVTFLGNSVFINVTGDFVNGYTTPLESYTSLIVEVQVEDFSTSLIMESGLVMDSYTWGESFDIEAYYFYEVASTPAAIGGATVTYTIPGYIVNEPLVTNGTDGYYTATLDTFALGLTSETPLNIYVTATKAGYTPITNTTLLNLQPVPMELLASKTSIDITWEENISLSVQLNDTFNDELKTGAIVSYTVANNPLIFGTLNPVGDNYVLDINSTVFGSTGSYVLNIYGELDEYTTPTYDVALKINDIQTEINGTIFSHETYAIYVSTSHNYLFSYTSGGVGIPNADTLDWELEDSNDSSFRITGSLVETGTAGLYDLVGFDSSALEVGSYSLVVHIGSNNFIERQSAIILNVLQIPVEYEGIDRIYTAPKGETINISLQLNDPVYDTVISGATVTITYDGQTFTMTEIGTTGVYFHVVDTEPYQTLARDKIFEADVVVTINENYTIDTIPVTIQIRPPMGPFNVPLIYWLIGGGVAVIALGAFGITKGIQYARIPWIIKQITTTRKGIKKKTRFTPAKITRSPGEIIADDAEGAYSTLGLSLKNKKPGKGKGKQKGPTTYKDLEEMGGNQ